MIFTKETEKYPFPFNEYRSEYHSQSIDIKLHSSIRVYFTQARDEEERKKKSYVEEEYVWDYEHIEWRRKEKYGTKNGFGADAFPQ